MLLKEDTAILHRFDRTNQGRTNQRSLEYDLWDLVQQIADQASVRFATSFSVTTSTKSITWISIKPPCIKKTSITIKCTIQFVNKDLR